MTEYTVGTVRITFLIKMAVVEVLTIEDDWRYVGCMYVTEDSRAGFRSSDDSLIFEGTVYEVVQQLNRAGIDGGL